MRLMTRSELMGRNENELAELFRFVSNDLCRTERDTAERRNGLATLENIMRARIAVTCDR